jgi:hypothetical protein
MDTPVHTSLEHAAQIMDKNMLGPDAAVRHFRVSYTEEELLQFAFIPYSEGMLHACKHTHVLFAGAQLSVNEVRKIAASDFYDLDWYSHEPFANDRKVIIRWYLLRKDLVPESRSKSYDEQTALLKGEEVPLACEMTYLVILYWLTHRERLLSDVLPGQGLGR